MLSQTIVMPKLTSGTLTLTQAYGYDGTWHRSARRWRATMTGRPPGSDSFVKRLEGMFVRTLAPKPAGRPKKAFARAC